MIERFTVMRVIKVPIGTSKNNFLFKVRGKRHLTVVLKIRKNM